MSMEIFTTAMGAVLPIVLLILLGYVLRQKGFLTDAFLAVGSKLVFRVGLPIMLFVSVYICHGVDGQEAQQGIQKFLLIHNDNSFRTDINNINGKTAARFESAAVVWFLSVPPNYLLLRLDL